ncbi:hypothetical protein FG386_003619 [Cryptosporidium ryanae]|uniref:uncharacterized protein n=1 Tax=Cryptosporidium ryanae TaxID=515981 RepID=UPI00351A5D72|nr:hypothetical protein FG386_003619 [Cryptosporidium ryanae]
MDRVTFMEGLRAFHESQGRAFRPQKVAGSMIDPYRMFLLIVSRGGFSRVNKNSRWFVFGKPLGIDIPEGKQQEIGLGIKSYYLNWLRDYEKAMDDDLKLSIAMDFATNNPELVPNPGLALSSYGASASGSIINGNEEAPPLTRSAAASLSRTGNKGSNRADVYSSVAGTSTERKEDVSVGKKEEANSMTGRNIYIIPRENCPCENLYTKNALDPDLFYSPKYKVSDDMWYLFTHLKNPEVAPDHLIHILNNLQSLATNEKLFLSSFPSLLNELSEAISLCTFSIDSLIQDKTAGMSLFLQSLNLQKLELTVKNKTCLLNVNQIQKDLLGSLSSLISSILRIKENCNFIFDLIFNPNVSRDFLSIRDLDNGDDVVKGGEGSLPSFCENKTSSAPPNTLKSSYLNRKFLDDELLKNLKSEYINCSGKGLNENRNPSLNIFNIEALFCSLLAAFRTSSSIIISYEKLLHNIIEPLFNKHRTNCIRSEKDIFKEVILKISNDSSEFFVEERAGTEYKNHDNNLETSNNIQKESETKIKEITKKDKVNMDFVLDKCLNGSSDPSDYKEEASFKEDDIIQHLHFETEMSWIVLSSTITCLNQLIPFVFNYGLDEIIVLLNFFVQELFGECHVCNNFSVPILSKCGEKVKGHPYLLPCTVYNPEGIKFLSDLLEFGCNIIINISSNDSLNKSSHNIRIASGFFQMILKLSSVCIGFHSFMKINDGNESDLHSCLMKEKIKKSVVDLFDKLVFPISLVTIATVSEHVSFEKIFHSIVDLNYHYLNHHTQFTQSLIKRMSCQIDPQVLEMSDSSDSFLKDQILVLWGREVIGPIFELLRSEMLGYVSDGKDEAPISCIMLSQYIIFISSELMSWNNSKNYNRKRNSHGMHSKSYREIAIGMLTPFIDVLIELAWLPSKYRNIFWSIISELSKFGVSNPSVTLGLTKVDFKLVQNANGN